MKVEGTSKKTRKANIHIVDRLPVHESYHLGFRIRLEFDAIPPELPYVQEEVHDTGVGIFPFDVEISRWYTVTVWAITHEGYGKRTIAKFLSAGDGEPFQSILLFVFV